MDNPYNLFTVSNRVKYLVATNYQATPVVEDFAMSAFPPINWTGINSNNGPSWSRVTNVGSFGNILDYGAIKFDFYTNPVSGDVDELYLPPMDLSGSATPSLSFDLAKAQRLNENDQLDILVSVDCGLTWSNVYSKAGQFLATSAAVTNAFIPSLSQDWITVTVALTGFASPNVLVKFRATNDMGNNMFIDNVNLSQSSTLGVLKNNLNNSDITIFPNPAISETVLTIRSETSGSSNIKMFNAIGEIIYTKQVVLNSGGNTIKIDTKELASGVYFVIVENGKYSTTKKLVISK
jgi:hypothetical protein